MAIVCRLCGKGANEIGGWLKRLNETGVPGLFECRPSCTAALSSDDALVAAIEHVDPTRFFIDHAGPGHVLQRKTDSHMGLCFFHCSCGAVHVTTLEEARDLQRQGEAFVRAVIGCTFDQPEGSV